MSDYKPKKKRERKWCEGGNKALDHMDYGEAVDTKKIYIRCPVCNQRFEIWNFRDTFFYDEVSRRIPKHKAY